MIVAVDQPNYIPWKGYFDLIHDVDLFIFYNDVQYTTRDWRNRNKIITSDGLKWLSVPVGHSTHRLIYEVRMSGFDWQKNHYDTLRHAYGKAPYFKKYKDFLESVYLERNWEYLHELDRYMIEHISKDFLGIKTKFADSRDFKADGAKHEKLLNLVLNIPGCEIYESGPAAKKYIVRQDYVKSGIKLTWKSYDGYPEYSQFSGSFIHQVSILDLLFHVGDDAPYYIWGWREETGADSWIEDPEDFMI